ncbi:hypothetical protein JMN32_16935 [Fulvivirga sp. 29W222]|uniref:Histidine kinase/HSP90-like ATPase domain-containing protein n=1 Tax=Fulvivirga marina TaxID=2494733 RepID=A0A937G107_9BACT|nr:sensor histidine kinase [Fulvivirga marina]MBL6448005.1 hypothetical protein [Fulvivirga marina]
MLSFLVQEYSGYGQSYNFINYGISDGLAHEKVLDFCEDKFGNLWIATLGGGLSKFNGLTFQNLTIRDGLASNYVRDVMVDNQGNIWAATAVGISRYDGRQVRNFNIADNNDRENSVNVIYEASDGNIWFSAPTGGIGKIDTKTEQIEVFEVPGSTPNDKVIAITEDKHGVLWFISAVKGLFAYDGSGFVNYVDNSEFKGYLLSVCADDNGVLWLGSNKGLLRFDPARPKVINDFFPPLKGIFIKSAIVKDTSNFWSVSAYGIMQYDHGQVRTFGEQQGFTNLVVNNIYCDREGIIWVGTDGDGIYKLSNEIFVRYGREHGLHNYFITSILQDYEGKYWVSSYGGGVDVFDKGSFRNLSTSDGLSNAYIWASTLDKQGNVWLGTKGSGLIRLDGENYTYLDMEDGLVYNSIRCLFSDSQNNLWIGTANGLSCYDGKSFYNYNVDNGLYDNTIWSISEPMEGKIMIVTRKGFSYYMEGEMKKGFNDKKVFNKRVNVALEDVYGNYWIGYSGHGLLRISKDRKEYELLTTDNGLTSDLVYNLIFDDDGNLIVGMERGVDKLFLEGKNEIRRIKNYGKTEGFKNIQTTHNAVYKDKEGNIWFGAPDGVFKFQPYKEHPNRVEPVTYISGVKLFYHEVNWGNYADSTSNWHNLPIDLQLPYNENNLVIEYFGSSLNNQPEVTYKFRLLGLEKEWSPLTAKSEAVYTNLSPGEYTFEVLASNSDGVWNEEPATFKFEIVPPFWQEVWFFLLLLVLIVAGIKLFNDYRVRANLNKILTVERIRAEELVKVRKRMARDFHDNMGNQLASITVFANLISLKLKDKSDEIDELLKNIEKHTKSLFNGTKDFIWSIDPESDHLGEVFTYIKDFGEDLFNNTNVSFFSKADDLTRKDLSLPSGWSRQIVLIFKEAMTNALKHAQADEVHLDLNLVKNEFVIVFKDNGVGLDHNRLGKGHGFKNMRSRASQISCTVEVESKIKSYGTIIRFRGSIQLEPKNEKLRFNN